VVKVCFKAPSNKQFIVVSETGSRVMIDRVLKRLLASEDEAQSMKIQRQSALTPLNYRFEIEGMESNGDHDYYRLRVEPLRSNKYLYRGRVWIDAKDFAVARIEAEPAENPSFWISHTEIEQQYAKIGTFWLPLENRSTSKVLLGGVATLTIEYSNYHLDVGNKKTANVSEQSFNAVQPVAIDALLADPTHHKACIRLGYGSRGSHCSCSVYLFTTALRFHISTCSRASLTIRTKREANSRIRPD